MNLERSSYSGIEDLPTRRIAGFFVVGARDVICFFPVTFLPAFGGRLKGKRSEFRVLCESQVKIPPSATAQQWEGYPSLSSSNRIHEPARGLCIALSSLPFPIILCVHLRRLLPRGNNRKTIGVKAARPCAISYHVHRRLRVRADENSLPIE